MTEFTSLAQFATYAKERATLVEMASKEYGIVPQAEWEAEWLHPDPNEEDCRFCRAMATCSAMSRKVQETVGASFTEVAEAGHVPGVVGHTITFNDRLREQFPDDDAALSAMMTAAGLIEDWITAVRAEVERRLLAGTAVAGWGLELGREGARRWTDPEEAERILRKVFRLPVEVSYDLKVISPTSAEKLVKAKTIGERQWGRMQAIIVRNPPKPSVKPAAQIKKPYLPGDPAPVDEFSTVSSDDDFS